MVLSMYRQKAGTAAAAAFAAAAAAGFAAVVADAAYIAAAEGLGFHMAVNEREDSLAGATSCKDTAMLLLLFLVLQLLLLLLQLLLLFCMILLFVFRVLSHGVWFASFSRYGVCCLCCCFGSSICCCCCMCWCSNRRLFNCLSELSVNPVRYLPCAFRGRRLLQKPKARKLQHKPQTLNPKP